MLHLSAPLIRNAILAILRDRLHALRLIGPAINRARLSHGVAELLTIVVPTRRFVIEMAIA